MLARVFSYAVIGLEAVVIDVQMGIGLVGGSDLPPLDGISPTHHGLLFLDQLPYFELRVFDVVFQK